jgi:hypothetical protein
LPLTIKHVLLLVTAAFALEKTVSLVRGASIVMIAVGVALNRQTGLGT